MLTMHTDISIRRCHSQAGFSLMELAIVLMIIGTLMGGVLVAVGQATLSGRRTSAQQQLQAIEEALYGFAQTTGRLPCPATHLTGGLESPTDGSGVCDFQHGFVPTATLGLSGAVNEDSLLLDPWQNPYRYSVEDSNNFTRIAELAEVFDSGLVATDLVVCDSADCTGNVIAANIPVIVYSMGANWADFASAIELENASTTAPLGGYAIADDEEFVTTTYSEDNFDDQLIWLSPYVLFNRMVSAGRLP